jgi:hypothetical protein
MAKWFRFRAQARAGAMTCGYEIIFTFYELGFSSPHFDMPGLGQGFKGSNRCPIFLIASLQGVRL